MADEHWQGGSISASARGGDQAAGRRGVAASHPELLWGAVAAAVPPRRPDSGLGDAGRFAPECGQRAAPRDDLLEQGVESREVVVARLENTVVLELGRERERDLLPDVCHLQLAADETKVFHRARAAGRAVGDEPHGLVVPLGIEIVERVLENAGGAVVVLGRDHHESVERVDLRRPLPRVIVLVLAEGWRHGLVKMREGIVTQVDELEVGVAALRCAVVHPARDLLSIAVRAGAAEDDSNLRGHNAPELAMRIAADGQAAFCRRARARSRRAPTCPGWAGSNGLLIREHQAATSAAAATGTSSTFSSAASL